MQLNDYELQLTEAYMVLCGMPIRQAARRAWNHEDHPDVEEILLAEAEVFEANCQLLEESNDYVS